MSEDSTLPNIEEAYCPIPLAHTDQIVLGHGSGGKMSHDLIRKVFMSRFNNDILQTSNDGAVIATEDYEKVVVSTDTHVIWPLFFPGGDIGRLSICGTVNDLAMMGATPRFLTAAFILEEGLPILTLERVVDSMKAAASEAGVQIIAGDTKVVPKGNADGVYINTTGVGMLKSGLDIHGANAKPGDVIILSGPIGEHGIAVLAARHELGIETDLKSDIAPLNHLVATMLSVSNRIHVLRDPTRGGLATTLNEIARQSNVSLTIHEDLIPVPPTVQAVCEMLGFDPLYIANEGKLVAIIDHSEAEKVLAAMHSTRYGEGAVIIGEVGKSPAGRVLLKTSIGSTRLVDMLSGEILPRIC